MRKEFDSDNGIIAIIKAIFKNQGRDFNTCEQCYKKGKTILHHTKYEKATIRDLQLVCQKCNVKTENKFLV